MPIIQPTHAIVDTLVQAIDSAKEEILFQTYYIDYDEVYINLAEKLIQKASQGVVVHCLFDALGSKDLSGSDIEKRLLEAGVHIQYFNWLTPWAHKNKKLWYFRNHKRSLIIDRQTVHVGGWCLGKKTQNWIDGYLKNSDPYTVTESIADFWNMYTYAHKATLHFRHQKKYTYSREHETSYSYQAPILRGRYVYYTHKKLCTQSTKKIVLVAPYFAPVRELRKLIYQAKKRGVHVEIYLPEKTDFWFVDLVARTYIHKLLKQGVSIYFSRVMIHAKVSLFDDVIYVGSMNLDPVSLRYNFENGIYTKKMTTIQEFETDVEVLRKTCEKLSLEGWKNRTMWHKFLDEFMKMFRAFV